MVVLAGVASLACGPPGVIERLESYQVEVQRALGEVGPPNLYPSQERFFPRLRERRLEVRDERIGILDFLSLQGCRPGELAGVRSSPLGRVMVGTRRLAYEAEVLAVARDCLELLSGERRERLARLVDRKREELPRHLWNALWTDLELAAYLSSERPPTADREADYATSALVALGLELERPALESEDGLWARYRRASRRHADAWAEPLRVCGLLPGGAVAMRQGTREVGRPAEILALRSGRSPRAEAS